MTEATLTLRHLSFTGPRKEATRLSFGLGLNVIHGASETGKSFILEAIDFMLGAKPDLRDIPERVGYDRVFLGIEDSAGRTFTLERGAAGGDFRRYDGLHYHVPQDAEPVVLRRQHNPTSDDNLSMFLLGEIGLAGKRIRKNARDETNSLSFRNLAHLCIVSEQDIQQRGSPILSGQVITRTAEYSTFKLLLTGMDDSAVQPSEADKNLRVSRSAKIEVMGELISENRERLTSLVGEDHDDSQLREQLTRLNESIDREERVLGLSERAYREALANRNGLRSELYAARERRAEIDELLARFRLLDDHYNSDLERLEGIREAGVLLSAFDNQPCPLCGAAPESQHLETECDGNIDAVVAAADAEHAKIMRLQKELLETVGQLQREAGDFDQLAPRIETQLEAAQEKLAELNPSLSQQRAAYSELLDKRSIVQNALNLLQSIADLEARIADLETAPESPERAEPAATELSHSTLDAFSKVYEEVLGSWSLPEANRVYFDKETRDFVINGKPRGARGKGMRAITYAAFAIALLEFTKRNKLPHPGFVVLDTPLLAYREPEGEEDDLTGTDVHERFYESLNGLTDRQIIVLENVDPPDALLAVGRTTFFSKNPHSGRYGFFPQ